MRGWGNSVNTQAHTNIKADKGSAYMKDKDITNVLLITENSFDAKRIKKTLRKNFPILLEVEWFLHLSDALLYLQKNTVNVILLSDQLPVHNDDTAFNLVYKNAPNSLIVIVSPSHLENKIPPHLNNVPEFQWLIQIVHYVNTHKTTERDLRKAEEALFDEKERAQVTLNSIGDCVLVTDPNSKITYLNSIAETKTGWACKDAVGRELKEVFNIVDGDTHLPSPNPAKAAMSANHTVELSANCLLISSNGTESNIEDSCAPIHDRSGKVKGAVIVFRDVSQSVEMTKKMAHHAQHDFLTGLPNRLLLKERLTQAIGAAKRNQTQAALMFIDLDFFKHVNDSLGHSIGDRLLNSVAKRLATCIRATDTLCRHGGDEFVILLSSIEKPRDTRHVIEKLFASLIKPHHIGGHELYVSISIGISIYPKDGENAEQLIQTADTAMYNAKGAGRSNFKFFHADMNIHAMKRQLMESNLRRALNNDEFILQYQPQFNLSTGLITGAEALVRWQDSLVGLIYPDQFIAIAEECGLIDRLGQWVMRKACSQVKKWLDEGLNAVPVAVNVSAVELRKVGFVKSVQNILEENQLDPKYLKIELTESVLLADVKSSKLALDALSKLGVQLALDDFGTGFSSLTYLRRFPIDILKIDGSFVGKIDTSEEDVAIVSSVISMGLNLKQTVIAEGIENKAQLDFLRAHNCNIGQGYYFSYPLNADPFSQLLTRQKNNVAAID